MLFGSSTRPLNDHSINFVSLTEAERNRQLRLRKIARTTLYQPRLEQIAGEQLHYSPDSIAIGLGSNQSKAHAKVSIQFITSIQICRTIIGGHQNVYIA